MVLRDVAEDIGMHESTVSRATANKYVYTPQGLFELKYFFQSGLRRSNGEDVASESVREKSEASSQMKILRSRTVTKILQGSLASRPLISREER